MFRGGGWPGFSWVGTIAAPPKSHVLLRRVLPEGDTSFSPLPPEWGGQGVMTMMPIFQNPPPPNPPRSLGGRQVVTAALLTRPLGHLLTTSWRGSRQGRGRNPVDAELAFHVERVWAR